MKNAENEAGRLALDIFLFFKKALSQVKESDLQLSSLQQVVCNIL